ncbi:MAG: LysR substrate-binding domain-containing protein [Paracoccaceae bacterium]
MPDLLNRLQWRHLRLIQAIEVHRQLSVAAERLAMTQPAASRMLAEIEGVIGHALFRRNPKGMNPTPIGEVLIRHAGTLLQGLAATVSEVGSFGEGKTGSVRVGSVTGAAVAYIVPAIQALKQEVSGADIHIHVGPSSALIEGLLDGDFDFVLSRVPTDNDIRHFEIMRGRVETVEFLVRPDHPLLAHKAHSLLDLAGYSWVIQAPGTPMRQAVEESFIARNVPLPDDIVNTSSLLVMIAYLQSSDSISPVSSEVADLLRNSDSGGIRSLKVRQSIIISPYHLIQKKEKMMSPLASRLRDLIIGALSTGSV